MKTKREKKRKLSTVKKEAWGLFSRYIRMRDCLKTTGCKDWGLCITCSKRYHIKLLQAGHFVSGRHNANLFSEKGTHAQCYNCNINLRGNTLEYRRKIIGLYGQGADVELENEANQIKKYTVPNFEALIIDLESKIKEIEENDRI